VGDDRLISAISEETCNAVVMFLDTLQLLGFEKKVPLHARNGDLPDEPARLLLLMGNLRYFRDEHFVSSINTPHPRFLAFYQSQFGVEFPQAYVQQLKESADALELMLLRKYLQLMLKPSSWSVLHSFSQSGFHWYKNRKMGVDEPPIEVRPEIMEVLLSVVDIHAMLFSAFGQRISRSDTSSLVSRGMRMVVDTITTAFVHAFRIPDMYSRDGAWQLYIDLSMVYWVLEVYLEDTSSGAALQEVLRVANQVATSGLDDVKIRRDVVKRGSVALLSSTQEATKDLWAAVRDTGVEEARPTVRKHKGKMPKK